MYSLTGVEPADPVSWLISAQVHMYNASLPDGQNGRIGIGQGLAN